MDYLNNITITLAAVNQAIAGNAMAKKTFLQSGVAFLRNVLTTEEYQAVLTEDLINEINNVITNADSVIAALPDRRKLNGDV